MYTREQILSFAKAEYDWAVDTRRQLHQIPEPGFHETKTKALIAQKLGECGIDYEIAEGGWITAYIEGSSKGKVTALRADFDALPIDEPEQNEFRSCHTGYMHACGHDMHTATMLATGRLLKKLPDGFNGGCLLMFEPAEETDGGAKPMAESGMMEKHHVDRVYGLHVMPRLLTGQVETRAGTLNAATDGISIAVHGKSSHGAYPEGGHDAIVCASQLVNALQTIVARNVSPLESAVITIGKISGGSASNIICDCVNMSGTLRSADPKLRAMIIERMQAMAYGIGTANNCEIELSVTEGYSALINDSFHAQRVLDTAKDLFGAENALIKDAPSMGGEDFSYFLDRAPGAFFHVGCSKDAQHLCAPLHSRDFLPDERAMEIGIAMEAALIINE